MATNGKYEGSDNGYRPHRETMAIVEKIVDLDKTLEDFVPGRVANGRESWTKDGTYYRTLTKLARLFPFLLRSMGGRYKDWKGVQKVIGEALHWHHKERSLRLIFGDGLSDESVAILVRLDNIENIVRSIARHLGVPR